MKNGQYSPADPPDGVYCCVLCRADPVRPHLCEPSPRPAHWPCCPGVTVVLLGCAAGLATGITASTIPALYAAHRDPAQILRTV